MPGEVGEQYEKKILKIARSQAVSLVTLLLKLRGLMIHF